MMLDGLMKFINRTARCSNFFRAQQLTDSGVSGVQCTYLIRICRQPGISQDQLAGQLYKDKSVVARQIATLMQRGYVRRELSPTDRRVQQLYPTEQTLELLPRMLEVFSEWEKILTQGFTDEEKETVYSLLSRIYENAEAETQREAVIARQREGDRL